jgi:hypothetical protein
MSNKSESVHEHVENMQSLDSGSSTPSERVTMTMMIFSLYIALNATIATFDSGYGGTVLLMASFNNALDHVMSSRIPKLGPSLKYAR